MENSGFGTTRDHLFTFPPHSNRLRRRPLQSQTYRTLLSILSHCNALQSFPQPQVPDDNDDIDSNKSGEEAEHESLVNHNGMDLEMSLVQQKSPFNETKEVHGFQDGGADTLNEVDGLDPTDIKVQGKETVTQDNNVNLVDSSVVNNQTCEVPHEKDICNVVDFHREFSPRRELNVFNEPFIKEVPETVSSSVDIDGIADMSIPVESNDAMNPTMEGHLPKGLEHELHLKQKELEKLVSTSGNLDLSFGAIEDDEIEEGEISGEISEEMDLLYEDAVSLEEKKSGKVQISEHTDKEAFTGDDGDARLGDCDTRSSMFLDTVDSETEGFRKEHTSAEVFSHSEETATKTLDGYDASLEIGLTAEQVSGVNKTDHPAISLENLSQHGLMHEDTAENKSSVDAKREASVGKKKRKKGPLTKERREKKKKKERIKRAAKNRELGVKRLKLQPLSKPKTVTYCRHYLNGRCQEGEKCKFSHDTTPLTKSKPCSYFARHSCMKGDNCPFDHQLSKYPCNNIVTNGFCSRGAGCLFSHEISAKDGSLPSSNVTKPESKSPTLVSKTISKKQVNHQGVPHQHADAKFSVMANFSGKSTEKKASEHLDRPSAQTPKGICFISHVRSPPGDSSKHKQAVPHLKGDNSEKVSYSMTRNLEDSIQKSNDLAKGAPSKMPRGINFLSFGKRPLDESLNRDGVSESLLGQVSKSKLVDSPLKSEVHIKIDNQAAQSSADLELKVNKTANIVSPSSMPQAMKFLSYGKTPVDNPTAISQHDTLRCIVNMGLPLVQRKEYALDGLKFFPAMPQRSASSSQPFDQSLDQPSAGGMLSFSKTSLLLNAPTSVQKALRSTLAFAVNVQRINCWKPLRLWT
ncbi:uncharacterized protein [Coffea arabica]|uniref:Uncharacterized protein isoform X2 n=1 Tax=Coffea arabica TaxID=13443 RepID=A0A6P6SRB6_COFAR|nr:uncharacterized protein LOC113693866 isoform X2 [Coffea arabica]